MANLPPGAFVELTKAGSGIERDVRLRRLGSKLRASGATQEDLDELGRVRVAARADGLRQAQAMLTFFETYGSAVAAFVEKGASDGRYLPARFADDFDGRAVTAARSLVGRYSRADQDDDGGICDAIDALVGMEYTEWFEGHGDEHEVYAQQWIAIGEDEGCYKTVDE